MTRSWRNRARASVVLALLFAAATSASDSLPPDSVYHLQGEWRDQDGTNLTLADLAGQPRLLSFVYTYCEHTCPTIVARLDAILRQLGENAPPGLQVTLVSLDPERDTPERMQAWMKDRGLDLEHWRMLHGTSDDVLAFAAMLGVRYRPMGHDDIAHSNMITVLDEWGAVRYQSKGLSDAVEGAVDALEELVQ